MNETIDHSDQIGKLQAIVILLTDWEPDGQWCHDPIYKKWKKSRYSLTTREFNTLITAFETRHRQLERQMSVKNYVQIGLFE